VCAVYALGGNASDRSNILGAFEIYGRGRTVVISNDQNYELAEKLNRFVNDVTAVEWRGF